MTSAAMSIRLFGGMTLTRDVGRPLTLPTRQTGLILAMLTEPVGRPLSRAQLIAELWPYADEEAGRNRLRVALAFVRKATEPDAGQHGLSLSTNRTTVTLSEEAVWVDTAEFAR